MARHRTLTRIAFNCFRLHCHIEKSQLGSAQGLLNLQVRGLDIKNVEPGLFGLGRSDPFFEISKKDFDHSISYVKWNVVYRSEHIKNHLNPYCKSHGTLQKEIILLLLGLLLITELLCVFGILVF